MADAVNEAVEALKELQPVSIALMGSFGRGEWSPQSDAEVAVIFADENYHSRTQLKKYGGGKVRLYPFRLSELLSLRSVIPFPRQFYFWWLKKTAKTIWGDNVLNRLEVRMRKEDWAENFTFQKGVALAAFISFRNNDLETAAWGFSKSCLFAAVSGLATKGKEVVSFTETVAASAEHFR